MKKIEIKDLPKDQKISKEELKKVLGGIIDTNTRSIIDTNTRSIIDTNTRNSLFVSLIKY